MSEDKTETKSSVVQVLESKWDGSKDGKTSNVIQHKTYDAKYWAAMCKKNGHEWILGHEIWERIWSPSTMSGPPSNTDARWSDVWFLFEQGGKGFAIVMAFHKKPKTPANLYFLLVDDSERKRGVGRKLVQEAIRVTRENAKTAYMVFNTEKTKAMNKFWTEKLGAIPTPADMPESKHPELSCLCFKV
jgi:GNAT superfamily N-acetyltransferase